MKKRTAGLAALALAVALGGTVTAAGATEVSDAPIRLLVADAVEAKVHVIDAGTGEHLGHPEVEVPAAVYAGPTGRYGYLVQRTADRTTVIDSGVEIVDHGDHVHIYDNPPSVHPFALETGMPTHFVTHGDQVAIFNDGDGTASIFREQDLTNGEPAVTTIDTGRAHHGVAVPMGDVVITSTPNPDPDAGTLPVGVDVRSLAGDILQSFHSCPGLHGEASSGDVVAFGCTDGVLLLTRTGDGFTATKVENPADTPEGTRVGTIRGAEGVGWFVGNFGADALAFIDPTARELLPVPLPAPHGSFALDHHAGGRILVLVADGTLHAIDPLGKHAPTEVELLAPFSLDRGVPRPAIALGEHHAFVSDPAGGRVVGVDLDNLSVGPEIAVDGTPARLAVLEHRDGDRDHHHDHGHQQRWSFAAVVSEGAAAGTTLTADLVIRVSDTGAIRGTATFPDGRAEVSGAMVDGNVSLTITASGASIFGVGRVGTDGTVAGVFVGPGVGDCGEWTASPLSESHDHDSHDHDSHDHDSHDHDSHDSHDSHGHAA